MNRSYVLHKTIEWFFYVGSLVMTLLSSLIFLFCYYGQTPDDFFSMACHVYWVNVLMYAGCRQISRRQFPANTESRKGELFMLFWTGLTIVFTVVTTFWMPQKMDLMKELITNFMVLAGILGGNEILKSVLQLFLNSGGKSAKKP